MIRLRWLWGDYIEPGVSLSREERTRINHRINANSPKLPNFWVILVGMMVGGMLCLAYIGRPLGDWIFGQFPGIGQSWSHGISVLVVAGVYTTVCIFILGHLYVSIARRSMCECGVRICIDCGYDLRGAGEDDATCPECGSENEYIPPTGADDQE